jgi:hypothetical protein
MACLLRPSKKSFGALRSSPAGFTLHAAGTVTADATHPESEIFENVTEVADLG